MKLYQLQVSTVMTVTGQGAPRSAGKSGASSALGWRKGRPSGGSDIRAGLCSPAGGL